MFVLNILIPKAIVIVKVVYWLHMIYLLGNRLYVVHFGVGLPEKVSHATLDLGLDLELADAHLTFQNLASLFFAHITFHRFQHTTGNRLLVFITGSI